MSDYIIHQGVDLHKRFFNFCSYDERTGRLREGRVYTSNQAQVSKYLDMFDAPARVAVEATKGWYWFVDALQGVGVEAKLSNPKQTKAIAWARVKGDRVDARMLCRLLMADMLPTCWIPEKPLRDAREMLRYRMKLVRIRTQLMNMVHSYLSKQNVHAPCESIWTVEGRRWLEGERLSYPHNEMKDYCLQLIDSVTEVIEVYDRKLRELDIKTGSAYPDHSLCGLYQGFDHSIGDRAHRTIWAFQELCSLLWFSSHHQGQWGTYETGEALQGGQVGTEVDFHRDCQ